MKAISIIPGTKNIHIKDWPEPELKSSDEIKVKVLKVGICGTDREEASGGRADAPTGESELIIGHEMVGQVVAVGKDVKNIHIGDYGVFTVRRGCSHCLACKSGFYDMCYTGDYKERGIKNLHGFQAQFVIDKEKYFVKIPASLKEIGVLTEPTTVVEKAIDEVCKIQLHRLPSYKNKTEWLAGKTALIAGLGPIGLLGAMILRLHHCNVIGLDIVDENSSRPQILKDLGGSYVNAKKTSFEDLKKSTPQIDLILEAAGIPKLDFELFSVLGANGIYVLTGVPAEGVALPVNGSHIMKQLVMKNQVLFGSVNAGFSHFEMAVKDLEQALKTWPTVIPRIISNKIPFNLAQEVLQKHTTDEIKVIIDWERS
jgi:threonine dehydrogenase-like Zn-dependent dehydrogenase